MALMEQKFGRMTGFSDHTIGAIGPLTSIAMGAVAVEKHYTNDPARKGPDHRFSATPEVMGEIAKGRDDIHALKGIAVKETTKAEEVSKSIGRRSAFATRDIPNGATITDADFRFVCPGVGIPPNDASALRGKAVNKAIAAGDPIHYDDIA